MSRTLERLKAQHPAKVASLYHSDGEGWDIELRRGWRRSADEVVHHVHGDTVREAVARFRAVVPCDCGACRRDQ